MADIVEMPKKSNLEDIRVPADAYPLGLFDGKMRYIDFDLNAFAEMEKAYGSMEEANKALSSGRMEHIRKILWLGCIWQETNLDPVTGEPVSYNITPFQVGHWLNARNMKSTIQKLVAAINGALPEEDKSNLSEEQRKLLEDVQKDSDIAAVQLNTDAAKAAGQVPNK
jgi:hypothetical protein